MRKGTNEAVAAWREAETKFHRIYKTSRCEARDAILAAGGWVTSSPDAKGFCQDYWMQHGDQWLTTGLSRSGECYGEHYGGIGPHADKVAPYHPEVGDRIRVLEKEHSEAAFAMYAAQAKVAELYVDVLGNELVEERTVMTILAKVVRAMVEAEG